SSTTSPDGAVSSTCVCRNMPGGCHPSAPSRKVVSHIFGRNKRQTLAIPDEFWVHMCRKHYQRESYRKDTFPLLQAELVLIQLDRLEQWKNVVDFSVSSKALPFNRAGGQKYGHRLVSPDGATDSTFQPQAYAETETPINVGGKVCGVQSKRSSFDDVRQLVMAIHHTIRTQPDLSSRFFPDIEILPNIKGGAA
ncbi:uncharacterized protein V1510DRAFT_351232, partial [Dipodascopsis tothii]|uniref:uncharacterized protein n=1 Tax=Dipodascopsis tothii TaxID=44089 RepID=UPI0034CF6DAD